MTRKSRLTLLTVVVLGGALLLAWGFGRRSPAKPAGASGVKALILAQDERSLDKSDKRSAFMAELRKTSGGDAGVILNALHGGEGAPLARSLALIVAGETASASGIMTICRLYGAAR